MHVEHGCFANATWISNSNKFIIPLYLIIEITDKKTTVASGLKAALFGIGFSLNISRTVQTDESLVKDNQNKEPFVQFYGGNCTSLKYDLEKGMPTGVDVQSWENSVSLSNACLTNINWKETYPIYDFISDPVKKEEIKQAVEKYIKASQLHVIELLPLYLYCHLDGNHYTTLIISPVIYIME